MNTNTPRTASMQPALLATVLFGFAGSHAGTVLAATPLSGAPAPDFVLKSLSGENVRLSEHRGQVVVVSFWATWCGDCRTQLEGLNAWYDTYQSAGLQLLAVSLDRSWEIFSKTAGRLDLTFPVLYDADLEVGRLYDVSSLPVTVLIDRDGVVRDVIEGYRRTGEQEFLDRVRALLREQW